MPFTGSCLCGACTYEYSGDAGPGIAWCVWWACVLRCCCSRTLSHCTSCRRYTGGLASFKCVVVHLLPPDG
jgi:hypothetical protein